MQKYLLLLFIVFSNFPTSLCAQDTITNIEQYHQNSKWQKSTALEVFNDFYKKQNFKGDETVVDVCSGDGKITSAIAQHFQQGNVTGVDASDRMVQFAQGHYANTGPHLSFKQMDAAKINLKGDADLITSFTCMHLIANQQEVLANFYQSLKPQGKLLMLFPVVHGFDSALDEVTASKKWQSFFVNFKPHWYFVNAKDYENLLTSAGFNIKRVETFTQDETYPSVEAFSSSISHWLPQLKGLPERLRADFLKDLSAAYVKQKPIDKDGLLHFYVDNMVVEAVRS